MAKKNKATKSDNDKKSSKNSSKKLNNQPIKKDNKVRVAKQSNQRIEDESKKIHYVLHPKQFKKKMFEKKELEQKERTKGIQTKKRKRNAAFLKTTSRGQPVLGARMKVLYEQIQRSCSSGS